VKAGKCSCFSLGFLSRYFDVRTVDVKDRIVNVLVPCPQQKFLSVTHENPDMYVPFWTSTTLIFAIGVSSNINEYLTSSSDDEYHYDLAKPSLAVSIVYAYLFIFGAALWLLLQYAGAKMETYTSDGATELRVSHTICLVGYAFIPFVPLILLCSVPNTSIELVALLCAGAYTTGILLRETVPLLKQTKSEESPWGKIPVVASAASVAVFAFSATCWFAFY